MLSNAKHLFVFLLFLLTIGNSYAQELIQIGGGGSDHLHIEVTTSHNEGVEIGDNLLSEVGLLPNLASTSRFLAQATLGASYELIDSVSKIGFSKFIDQQYAIPYTFSCEDYTNAFRDRAISETMDTVPPAFNYYRRFFTSAWTYDVINSEDLIRARVAFALSQIFVISDVHSDLRDKGHAQSHYYDMLSTHALGNYRDLLEAVTLHPAMGSYLTHINNPKSDTTLNRFPDENYAREIMQLFSIGLNQLNLDGSLKLDINNNPIPTYNNQEIGELAKVFTGLTWGNAGAFGQDPVYLTSWTQPMQMIDEWHEPGEKKILDDFIVADTQPVDGMADIQATLDYLFNHPNVAPFICHQLIQRLVTANPSPGYIERVSTVFNNNGNDVRGDFKAVVRAILLDPEARDCQYILDDYEGKLREPTIRYTHLLRAFDFSTPSGEIRNNLYRMRFQGKHSPLDAPSVFNFYRPDFSPTGDIKEAGKVAPEFQILDGNTIVGYSNLVQTWMFNQYTLSANFRLYSTEYENPGFDSESLRGSLDLEHEFLLGKDESVGELLERLNLILAHGRLSYKTKNFIIEAVKKLPEQYSNRRVQAAMFLVMISPEYLIFK